MEPDPIGWAHVPTGCMVGTRAHPTRWKRAPREMLAAAGYSNAQIDGLQQRGVVR